MSDLSLEDILIFEALDYRETSGASGQQLSIKECQNPACGNDKWDKVYANQATGAGKCFKCGETFNIWVFVRWLLQSRGGSPSNRDVGIYLANVGKSLGYRPKGADRPKPVAVVEGDFELPQSMALPDLRGKNHAYLEKRGIDGQAAGEFGLRYSMFGSHTYVDQKGETKRQSFAERIIFPVWNLDGKMVTFQGRDITGLSDTRYKFAGGLPGTGRYLYNGHVALQRKAKHVVMCEGPTDVIKTGIALRHAPDLMDIVPVGSFGMNLSSSKEGDDQLGAFKRLRRAGLETVTIMWDGEEDAFSAALDAAELLIKAQLKVRIATLPMPTPQEKTDGLKSHDPGSVDAKVIHQAIRDAVEVTRLTLLRLRMKNPYRAS